MTTLTALIVVALSLIIFVQSVFFALQSRQMKQLRDELNRFASDQQAVLATNAQSLAKLQATVSMLEKKLNRTMQRQQDLENKDAGSLTYEQASKLIELGAAPEDLVKTCGLSQAEAHLVSLMAARGIAKSS
jgi:hypothetical protein